MPHKPANILFVCTGNVFRSMTAEFAARIHAKNLPYTFHSAGTHSHPDIRALPHVGEYLQQIGLDVLSHKPRLLAQPLLDKTDFVIAMSDDHKSWIQKTFQRDCHLFLEVATGQPVTLPDVCDVLEDHTKDPEAANAHISRTIDIIVANTKPFVERLPSYFK